MAVEQEHNMGPEHSKVERVSSIGSCDSTNADVADSMEQVLGNKQVPEQGNIPAPEHNKRQAHSNQIGLDRTSQLLMMQERPELQHTLRPANQTTFSCEVFLIVTIKVPCKTLSARSTSGVFPLNVIGQIRFA